MTDRQTDGRTARQSDSKDRT